MPESLAALHIDPTSRRVRIGSREARLTPAELRLLQVLATQPGRVVTREQMMHSLWESTHGDGHACEVHVSNLRKKLEPDPRRPTLILTVRGRGYMLAAR